MPVKLSSDQGWYSRDQNTTRSPEFPFKHMFEATNLVSPGFSFKDVDIVTDRNSLLKLFYFCCGASQSPFQISLHRVGKSLFIQSCEPAWTFLDDPNRYRFTFERALAKYPPEALDSTGHYRVVQYALGDLNCVVRFEADARLWDGGQTPPSSFTGFPTNKWITHQDLVQFKPTSSTSEVGRLDLCLPKLWFGRTRWLVVGQHDDGNFYEVTMTDAATEFET